MATRGANVTAELSRRRFLRDSVAGLSGLSVAALAGCSDEGTAVPTATPGKIVDFHVHLFGVGDGGTGCYLSPAQREHASYATLVRLLDLPTDGGPEKRGMDEAYVQRLVSQLRASAVDRAVLVGQDCRYDDRGDPLPGETDFYVPNDYVFDVVARYPDLLVPCVSINPRRRDAVAELERCASKGARVVKVHPPTQAVDPGDPAFRPFYRRMAELSVVLMVHTGTENAAHVADLRGADPRRLETALQEGCTVVAAHSGFGSFLDPRDMFESMQDMVRKHPRLYCDTAVLATIFRWRCLPRLLADEQVLARAVHASDWPFPPNAMVFWNRMAPSALARLLEERNLFDRDLGIKQALGFPAAYFERGAALLGV